MSFHVMLVIVFAALLHATWNALVKSQSNKLIGSVLLSVNAGMLGFVASFFLHAPHPASWPYLGASVAIHTLYFCLVAFAYRDGDLSFVYPFMRGSAPLFTALISVGVLGERITDGAWLGVLLLCTGVLILAADNWRTSHVRGRAWLYGLINAAVIVGYTIVDGLGVRVSGNAWSYVVWMFFLNAFPMLTIGIAADARALASLSRSTWVKGFLGGSCTVGSYGLALWAMTHAPIPLVAALRETSVLFGTGIAMIVLGERFGCARWVAAGLITSGAAAMKAL
jgi:drug/metabolite transporter (DMT)-like permease